jgi:hypothetical protein
MGIEILPVGFTQDGARHAFDLLMVSPTLLENISRSDIDDITRTDTNFIVVFKNGARAFIPLGQGSATLRYILDHTEERSGRKLMPKQRIMWTSRRVILRRKKYTMVPNLTGHKNV